METEIVLFEKLADNLPVEIIQIQDTQVAPGLMDIFNDLEGSRFSQCPLVLLDVQFFDEIDESIDGESVVLSRDGKLAFERFCIQVTLFQKFRLFHNLARVGKEFRPFQRQGNALGRTAEDLKIQFIFQFPDRFGQAGLGYEKPFGSLIDGTAVDDADDIF